MDVSKEEFIKKIQAMVDAKEMQRLMPMQPRP